MACERPILSSQHPCYVTKPRAMLQESGMTWRVDKDEAPTLFNRMRGNLLALAGSDRRATRLRTLLIDRQPPRVAAAERSLDEQQADDGSQVGDLQDSVTRPYKHVCLLTE